MTFATFLYLLLALAAAPLVGVILYFAALLILALAVGGVMAIADLVGKVRK